MPQTFTAASAVSPELRGQKRWPTIIGALAAVLVFAVLANPVSAEETDPPDASGVGATTVRFRCNGEAATIVGTPGPDVLVGTEGRDVIVGRGGDDTIVGLTGDDTICGGGGQDIIKGGGGRDWLSGSKGLDIIFGGAGKDIADDFLAICTVEKSVGCNQLPPSVVDPMPACGDAPEWVVSAIYESFSDTPHVCYFADTIAYRESRWTPDIIGGPNRNGTFDYGLLQLNSAYIQTWAEWADVDWNDWDQPVEHAKMARAVYDRSAEIWGNPLQPWRVRR